MVTSQCYHVTIHLQAMNQVIDYDSRGSGSTTMLWFTTQRTIYTTSKLWWA